MNELYLRVITIISSLYGAATSTWIKYPSFTGQLPTRDTNRRFSLNHSPLLWTRNERVNNVPFIRRNLQAWPNTMQRPHVGTYDKYNGILKGPDIRTYKRNNLIKGPVNNIYSTKKLSIPNMLQRQPQDYLIPKKRTIIPNFVGPKWNINSKPMSIAPDNIDELRNAASTITKRLYSLPKPMTRMNILNDLNPSYNVPTSFDVPKIDIFRRYPGNTPIKSLLNRRIPMKMENNPISSRRNAITTAKHIIVPKGKPLKKTPPWFLLYSKLESLKKKAKVPLSVEVTKMKAHLNRIEKLKALLKKQSSDLVIQKIPSVKYNIANGKPHIAEVGREKQDDLLTGRPSDVENALVKNEKKESSVKSLLESTHGTSTVAPLVGNLNSIGSDILSNSKTEQRSPYVKNRFMWKDGVAVDPGSEVLDFDHAPVVEPQSDPPQALPGNDVQVVDKEPDVRPDVTQVQVVDLPDNNNVANVDQVQAPSAVKPALVVNQVPAVPAIHNAIHNSVVSHSPVLPDISHAPLAYPKPELPGTDHTSNDLLKKNDLQKTVFSRNEKSVNKNPSVKMGIGSINKYAMKEDIKPNPDMQRNLLFKMLTKENFFQQKSAIETKVPASSVHYPPPTFNLFVKPHKRTTVRPPPTTTIKPTVKKVKPKTEQNSRKKSRMVNIWRNPGFPSNLSVEHHDVTNNIVRTPDEYNYLMLPNPKVYNTLHTSTEHSNQVKPIHSISAFIDVENVDNSVQEQSTQRFKIEKKTETTSYKERSPIYSMLKNSSLISSSDSSVDLDYSAQQPKDNISTIPKTSSDETTNNNLTTSDETKNNSLPPSDETTNNSLTTSDESENNSLSITDGTTNNSLTTFNGIENNSQSITKRTKNNSLTTSDGTANHSISTLVANTNNSLSTSLQLKQLQLLHSIIDHNKNDSGKVKSLIHEITRLIDSKKVKMMKENITKSKQNLTKRMFSSSVNLNLFSLTSAMPTPSDVPISSERRKSYIEALNKKSSDGLINSEVINSKWNSNDTSTDNINNLSPSSDSERDKAFIQSQISEKKSFKNNETSLVPSYEGGGDSSMQSEKNGSTIAYEGFKRDGFFSRSNDSSDIHTEIKYSLIESDETDKKSSVQHNNNTSFVHLYEGKGDSSMQSEKNGSTIDYDGYKRDGFSSNNDGSSAFYHKNDNSLIESDKTDKKSSTQYSNNTSFVHLYEGKGDSSMTSEKNGSIIDYDGYKRDGSFSNSDGSSANHIKNEYPLIESDGTNERSSIQHKNKTYIHLYLGHGNSSTQSEKNGTIIDYDGYKRDDFSSNVDGSSAIHNENDNSLIESQVTDKKSSTQQNNDTSFVHLYEGRGDSSMTSEMNGSTIDYDGYKRDGFSSNIYGSSAIHNENDNSLIGSQLTDKKSSTQQNNDTSFVHLYEGKGDSSMTSEMNGSTIDYDGYKRDGFSSNIYGSSAIHNENDNSLIESQVTDKKSSTQQNNDTTSVHLYEGKGDSSMTSEKNGSTIDYDGYKRDRSFSYSDGSLAIRSENENSLIESEGTNERFSIQHKNKTYIHQYQGQGNSSTQSEKNASAIDNDGYKRDEILPRYRDNSSIYFDAEYLSKRKKDIIDSIKDKIKHMIKNKENILNTISTTSTHAKNVIQKFLRKSSDIEGSKRRKRKKKHRHSHRHSKKIKTSSTQKSELIKKHGDLWARSGPFSSLLEHKNGDGKVNLDLFRETPSLALPSAYHHHQTIANISQVNFIPQHIGVNNGYALFTSPTSINKKEIFPDNNVRRNTVQSVRNTIQNNAETISVNKKQVFAEKTRDSDTVQDVTISNSPDDITEQVFKSNSPQNTVQNLTSIVPKNDINKEQIFQQDSQENTTSVTPTSNIENKQMISDLLKDSTTSIESEGYQRSYTGTKRTGFSPVKITKPSKTTTLYMKYPESIVDKKRVFTLDDKPIYSNVKHSSDDTDSSEDFDNDDIDSNDDFYDEVDLMEMSPYILKPRNSTNRTSDDEQGSQKKDSITTPTTYNAKMTRKGSDNAITSQRSHDIAATTRTTIADEFGKQMDPKNYVSHKLHLPQKEDYITYDETDYRNTLKLPLGKTGKTQIELYGASNTQINNQVSRKNHSGTIADKHHVDVSPNQLADIIANKYHVKISPSQIADVIADKHNVTASQNNDQVTKSNQVSRKNHSATIADKHHVDVSPNQLANIIANKHHVKILQSQIADKHNVTSSQNIDQITKSNLRIKINDKSNTTATQKSDQISLTENSTQITDEIKESAIESSDKVSLTNNSTQIDDENKEIATQRSDQVLLTNNSTQIDEKSKETASQESDHVSQMNNLSKLSDKSDTTLSPENDEITKKNHSETIVEKINVTLSQADNKVSKNNHSRTITDKSDMTILQDHVQVAFIKPDYSNLMLPPKLKQNAQASHLQSKKNENNQTMVYQLRNKTGKFYLKNGGKLSKMENLTTTNKLCETLLCNSRDIISVRGRNKTYSPLRALRKHALRIRLNFSMMNPNPDHTSKVKGLGLDTLSRRYDVPHTEIEDGSGSGSDEHQDSESSNTVRKSSVLSKPFTANEIDINVNNDNDRVKNSLLPQPFMANKVFPSSEQMYSPEKAMTNSGTRKSVLSNSMFSLIKPFADNDILDTPNDEIPKSNQEELEAMKEDQFANSIMKTPETASAKPGAPIFMNGDTKSAMSASDKTVISPESLGNNAFMPAMKTPQKKSAKITNFANTPNVIHSPDIPSTLHSYDGLQNPDFPSDVMRTNPGLPISDLHGGSQLARGPNNPAFLNTNPQDTGSRNVDLTNNLGARIPFNAENLPNPDISNVDSLDKPLNVHHSSPVDNLLNAGIPDNLQLAQGMSADNLAQFNDGNALRHRVSSENAVDKQKILSEENNDDGPDDNVHDETDNVHSRSDRVHDGSDNGHDSPDNGHDSPDNGHDSPDNGHDNLDNGHDGSDNGRGGRHNRHKQEKIMKDEPEEGSERTSEGRSEESHSMYEPKFRTHIDDNTNDMQRSMDNTKDEDGNPEFSFDEHKNPPPPLQNIEDEQNQDGPLRPQQIDSSVISQNADQVNSFSSQEALKSMQLDGGVLDTIKRLQGDESDVELKNLYGDKDNNNNDARNTLNTKGNKAMNPFQNTPPPGSNGDEVLPVIANPNEPLTGNPEPLLFNGNNGNNGLPSSDVPNMVDDNDILDPVKAAMRAHTIDQQAELARKTHSDDSPSTLGSLNSDPMALSKQRITNEHQRIKENGKAKVMKDIDVSNIPAQEAMSILNGKKSLSDISTEKTEKEEKIEKTEKTEKTEKAEKTEKRKNDSDKDEIEDKISKSESTSHIIAPAPRKFLKVGDASKSDTDEPDERKSKSNSVSHSDIDAPEPRKFLKIGDSEKKDDGDSSKRKIDPSGRNASDEFNTNNLFTKEVMSILGTVGQIAKKPMKDVEPETKPDLTDLFSKPPKTTEKPSDQYTDNNKKIMDQITQTGNLPGDAKKIMDSEETETKEAVHDLNIAIGILQKKLSYIQAAKNSGDKKALYIVNQALSDPSHNSGNVTHDPYEKRTLATNLVQKYRNKKIRRLHSRLHSTRKMQKLTNINTLKGSVLRINTIDTSGNTSDNPNTNIRKMISLDSSGQNKDTLYTGKISNSESSGEKEGGTNVTHTHKHHRKHKIRRKHHHKTLHHSHNTIKHHIRHRHLHLRSRSFYRHHKRLRNRHHRIQHQPKTDVVPVPPT